MLKIKKYKQSREISFEEFLKFKKLEPFSNIRQDGKITNFSFLFGGSPSVLSQGEMSLVWTEDMADNYIKKYRLQETLYKLEDRYAIRKSAFEIKLLTAASHMREGFLKLYKGLARRIDANREFAQAEGYVRFIFGGSRNLIPLLLQGEYDRQERSLQLNNLRNIAVNADIQNFESSIINQAMVELNAWFEAEGMRSYIFNMIHDSVDMVLFRDEIDRIVPKVQEVFEKSRVEYRGVPLTIDLSISDLLKGDYYKHGKDIELS